MDQCNLALNRFLNGKMVPLLPSIRDPLKFIGPEVSSPERVWFDYRQKQCDKGLAFETVGKHSLEVALSLCV